MHLADTLKHLGLDLRRVFAPEHGFRGTADAGAYIENGVDQKTGPKNHFIVRQEEKTIARRFGQSRFVGFRHSGCRSTILHLSIHPSLRYGSLCRTKYTAWSWIDQTQTLTTSMDLS